MEFRILGPLEVCGDAGEPIGLTQRLHRRLLAQLLLHAGQPRSRRELVEALWGDEPPAGPGTALRTCVHGVRKALGGYGGRLQTHSSGYLFRVIAGESDLPMFRALAGQGRAALDRAEPAAAAGLLAQALELWRDPPLADLPPTAEKARLIDQHRDAREALMDARLALGHHHDALTQLRGIVAADPLREHAWAQLMLALYRSGARAEALAAFRTIRRLLSEAHGIDPGPELLELHGQILNDDPVLAVRPSSAGGPAGPWLPVFQLPAALPDFTGRGEEVMALMGRLPGRGMAVTVISGMPGAGKTALAIHVAHLAGPYFPDGQLYAQLGGCEQPRDPQDVLGELLRGLGVPPAGVPPAGAEREALYRSVLAGRKVLVIADGASTSAQVRPLLPGTAGSAVLVTSRSALADLEGAAAIRLGDLPAAEATSLLTRIVGHSRAAAEPGAAQAIARACAYLPLALRICGARLVGQPGLTLDELACALRDDRHRLAELVIGDQSVRERIASSERALDDHGRRALALLALHAPDDAPAWLVPVLLDEPAGTDIAAQLADMGLLWQVSGSGATAVYRLHPLVRGYAAEILAAADPAQTGATARRVMEAWLELADHADQQLARRPHVPAPARLTAARVPAGVAARSTADGPGWLGQHAAQLSAAITRACADGRYQQAAELASRQLTYQLQRSQHAEASRHWTQIAAAANQAGDALAAARARYQLAVVTAAGHGRSLHAQRILDGCLPAFQMARDQRATAAALALKACCAEADEDLDKALRSAEQSLDAALQLDDRLMTCTSLSILGVVLARLGCGEQGVVCCLDAAAIAADMAEPDYATAARRALSRAQIEAGRSGPVSV